MLGFHKKSHGFPGTGFKAQQGSWDLDRARREQGISLCLLKGMVVGLIPPLLWAGWVVI